MEADLLSDMQSIYMLANASSGLATASSSDDTYEELSAENASTDPCVQRSQYADEPIVEHAEFEFLAQSAAQKTHSELLTYTNGM